MLCNKSKTASSAFCTTQKTGDKQFKKLNHFVVGIKTYNTNLSNESSIL